MDGSDEEGCETPLWIFALVLFGVGFSLVVTLFLYSFKSIYEAVRNIRDIEEVPNDTSSCKQLYIAILTENRDTKMIEQLFINEVMVQGNEREAICYFKVLFCFHCTFKYNFKRREN